MSAGPSRSALWLFFGAQTVCVICFLGSQLAGARLASALSLAMPFQLLAWCVMLRDEVWLLLGFVALVPLSGLELLPFNYWRFVFYPVSLLLLWVMRVTRFLDRGNADAGKLARDEVVALGTFGVCVVASAVHAFARGLAMDPPMLLYYTVLALEFVAVAYFFATVPRTLDHVRAALVLLVVGYVLTTCTLPFLGVAAQESLGGKTLMAPFGGYVNMNAYAAHVCVALLVLLGIMHDMRRSHGVVAGLGALVLLAALLITRSRGAWLGFGLGILYLLARTRSGLLLAAVASGLAVLLASDALRSSVLSRFEATSTADPSLTGRLVLWATALRVVRDHWFLGVGFENFRLVKHLYQYPVPLLQARQYNSHNLLLEVLTDLGVLGLLSFVWLQISALVRLNRVAGGRVREHQGLAAGLNAALLAYSVHGLWDCLTWQHGAFILLAMLLGLAWCVSRLRASRVPALSSVQGPG